MMPLSYLYNMETMHLEFLVLIPLTPPVQIPDMNNVLHLTIDHDQ